MFEDEGVGIVMIFCDSFLSSSDGFDRYLNVIMYCPIAITCNGNWVVGV